MLMMMLTNFEAIFWAVLTVFCNMLCKKKIKKLPRFFLLLDMRFFSGCLV